ncbi:molybdopterin-dependent oxidoreductase [[Clostridium] symbiosum]|uniref:xanthine dehydrogenase family protein molybdopterin-binding subunit n=1 Tax=Clostridium symbiosum TaxID=1512 RepID=UPI00210AE88B|nr:molybdopterin cofactor-binding domain-containing protein [[Clostridium] symbiosum]MCQ4836406.1 molybdopterin-dependent oxidoreductase [[Clostridium] symbiosum]
MNREKNVNRAVMKKDAMALVTGAPVYTDDLAPKDCLVVKVLRSPHAHALVKTIDTKRASAVPGIACVLTWEDSPACRFTQAGQTYPEPSPYDRRIIDRRLRFVGDVVAIVAGDTEQAVDRALKLIKTEYEVLKPVLDFRKAKDNPVLVHPEEDWKSLCPVGADNKRNLCSSGSESDGDVEAVLKDCDLVIERTYHTKADNQTMMETFRAFTYLDAFGRLNVVASTQIPFHIRRILANALGIPKSAVRVVKPRIGGGFGAKQTGVAEIYPAIVTMKTGRPAKMIYTRYESMIAASPRHEMEVTVRMGLSKEGKVRAVDMYTLSNTGAYGEHGPTTVGLSGHKAIPIYTPEAFRFTYDVVYTNYQSSGAYRGYGATQGLFAVETALNEAAALLGIDPLEIRRKNFLREGQIMPAYYNERLESCHVSQCMEKARAMMDWDKKYPFKDMGNGKVRGVGVGISMQGSGIPCVDVGTVTIRLSDEGHYNMMIGATDMGTGCDTILSQMAADCMDCDVKDIVVSGVDTDVSPYDSGSYASSTTYVTGMAVVKACKELREKIIAQGAELLGIPAKTADFDGACVYAANEDNANDGSASISLKDISTKRMCGSGLALEATVSHSSPTSPPPFMCGMAEVEVDLQTGEIELLEYKAAVDCGTVINPNLARIQAEGGIVQGIGMALFEDINYTDKGRLKENSFMQYKIPARVEIPDLEVEFDSSYEPSGPFGAKSVGEVVMNTPLPAIVQAVYHATGLWFRELPVTPEKVIRGLGKLR